MLQGKRRWLWGIGSAATLLGVGAIALVMIFGHGMAAVHASQGGQGDGIGSAKFTTDGGTGFRTSDTVPYWSSSFTDPTNGVTYPYTMVGTNPFSGSASSTIPTEIIPLSFTFANSASANNVLDGSTKVALTQNSPIFNAAGNIGKSADKTASAPPGPPVSAANRTVNEPSDTTQVGDAFMRAQFNKVGTGYHVLLGQPTIYPTVSISVPQNQGFLLVGSVSHARIGLMSYSWFSSNLQNLLGQLHIDAHTLPIFLTYNTFLYEGNPNNCCVLGYHGAESSSNGNGAQGVQTYIYAAYSDPGIFAANPGDSISYIQDIHALSHEVSEWLDDPFTNNAVNPWLTPTAPQYGCTSILEVGDPVVGYGFEVSLNGTIYHPEDEVFFSWFARQKPSISAAGYYTYLNNFADVAHGC